MKSKLERHQELVHSIIEASKMWSPFSAQEVSLDVSVANRIATALEVEGYKKPQSKEPPARLIEVDGF